MLLISHYSQPKSFLLEWREITHIFFPVLWCFLKQVAAEKVHNLPEAELKALLDEAVKYRGKKDREQSTALFQVPSSVFTQDAGTEN